MKEDQAAYTVKQTRQCIPLSPGALYAGILNGEIPSIKIGRRVLIPAWWIREQIDGPKTEARNRAVA